LKIPPLQRFDRMVTRTSPPQGVYDETTVAAADTTVEAAIRDLLDGTGTPRGVVVPAPAGAGKSRLVVTAVDRARARGRRVAVAAPTNEQAFGLVRTIANVHCAGRSDRAVTFVPASTVSLPDSIRTLAGVREEKAKDASGHDLIVGTLSKLGDAFARGDLRPFDVLLIDEAYQADSAKYFAVGGLAPVHLLVGDAGQINPFATVADPGRWRGLAEDPLQTAVGVLRRNHPRHAGTTGCRSHDDWTRGRRPWLVCSTRICALPRLFCRVCENSGSAGGTVRTDDWTPFWILQRGRGGHTSNSRGRRCSRPTPRL
jgi:hypothetical protein